MSGGRENRTDQELAKALAHPIRVEILEALRGRVASPSELSEEMNESLGVISYHANTLVRCGCLELVHRAPRGGGVEHFFGVASSLTIGDRGWSSVPPELRAEIAGAALDSLMRAAAADLEGGEDEPEED